MYAVSRAVELTGEAASRVPDGIREAHRDVPWRAIVGTRNVLVHAYAIVSLERVRNMVIQDIPELLVAVRAILDNPDRK